MSSSAPLPPTPSALVAEVVQRDLDDLLALRRDLHAHPELSWNESRTTGIVEERLVAAGWRVQRLPSSGLVADLGRGERSVGLRADLDALPVEDVTDDPWVSTVPGVAHACGHDVHTTALLGAARALARLDDVGELGGRVRLFFQPAEEVMPGGALEIVGQGLVDGLEPCTAARPSTSGRSGCARARSPAPPTSSRSGWSGPAVTPRGRT